jgi:hypothetical protein
MLEAEWRICSSDISLPKFLAWLIDARSESFEKANEPHAMSKEKLRKVLVMVESIVSVARCTFTPFHPSSRVENLLF